MRIDRIELVGFKSFAEKTTFTFHPGITCIVGPNGCGKSNIVDAFRWVLGEQSAKTLRGERMEEVIFNGSQSRKPRGMAEVTMYIAIPDDQGNGNKGERIVTVTRRLYRSGESEYMINRQVCRLKDIREMFLDTGLEMKRYSIIEQGSIGELINAKPQDRRYLIEEVAGIMKYKVRKNEAMAKLESSRLNLQRVSDILAEVKRQRNSLDRQAKKAARYKKLLEELKEVELRVARTEFLKIKAALAELEERINRLKTEEAEKRTELTTVESKLHQRRIGVIEREKELEQRLAKLQRMEQEIAEMERTSAVLRRDIEHTTNSIATLKEQINETEQTIQERIERLEGLKGKDSDIKAEIDSLQGAITEQEDEIRSAGQVIASLEEELASKRKEVFVASDTIGGLKNTLHRLEATKEGVLRRLSAARRELEEARRRTGEIESELDAVEKEIQKKLNVLDDKKKKRSELSEELSAKKAELSELSQRKTSLREEVISLQTRANALMEMIKGSNEQKMLEDAGVHVLTTLSEIIEVDPRYEVAVEAALSERLKGFVLSSLEELKRAVEVISEGGFSRQVLLLSDPAFASVPDAPQFDQLRPLSPIVKTSDTYRKVINSLLSGYYLVEDVAKGLETLKTLGDNSFIRLVTPKGEVIEPGGVVVAGKGSEILHIRRQLREIESSVNEKNEQIGSCEAEIAVVTARIESIKEMLKAIDEEIISSDREISLLRASAKRHQEDIQRLKSKEENLKIEIEQLETEKDDIDRELFQKQGAIDQETERKTLLETELEHLQAEINDKRSDLELKRQAVAELKIRMKGLTERMNSFIRERESLEADIRDMEMKRESYIQEIRNRERLIEEKTQEAERIEVGLKDAVTRAEELKKEISRMRDMLQEIKQGFVEDEDRLKALRQELDRIGSELHTGELSWTEQSMKLSGLKESMSEKYQIDIEDDTLPASAEYDEDRERVNQLKEKIQSMGQVNLGALEEFNELNERYEFLQSQHDDIVQSITELEEAIRRINRTTKKMLTDAFEALNRKFNEVFKQLFGGGSAELRLTDENNILESGIDVIVQPPGKRLQNITLLSGGEKALAALSLMFAGFLLKPTPLCILDEADAPLDENNTVRFREMLKELSKEIQFIVITHNRITMEAADYLYGVTMDEPGVSKVLSMEFAEA